MKIQQEINGGSIVLLFSMLACTVMQETYAANCAYDDSRPTVYETEEVTKELVKVVAVQPTM